MKPFNLEAALAGAPVCTRDGRPVTQLVKFDVISAFNIGGVLDRDFHRWKQDGAFDCFRCEHDLFMAPIKKTGWVARLGGMRCIGLFGSEGQAKELYPEALSYHQIEWEE